MEGFVLVFDVVSDRGVYVLFEVVSDGGVCVGV